MTETKQPDRATILFFIVLAWISTGLLVYATGQQIKDEIRNRPSAAQEFRTFLSRSKVVRMPDGNTAWIIVDCEEK